MLAGGARTLVKDGLSLELLLTIPLGVFSGLLLLLIVCFPWVVIDETLSKEGKRVPNIVRAGLKVATMVAYTVIAIRLI